MAYFKGLLSNAKSKVALASASVVGATSGFSAVTVGENGILSGSLDMAGYNSALGIAIGATVVIVIGGIILRTIKKV